MIAAMQLLVVEDEETMRALLQRGLSEEGHNVSAASSGTEALELATSFRFDVIVLDVMLPRLSGFEVARRLRAARDRTPILFLTARDAITDRVQGLDLGGDDYLTKPFSFEELLARVRALGRRTPLPSSVVLSVGDLLLDTSAHVTTRAGRTVTLTPKEYSLLELLMRRAGQVVPREVILTAVWGFDSEVETNTLDAFVRLLRQKVDHGFDSKLIHTVRGVGYVIREESA